MDAIAAYTATGASTSGTANAANGGAGRKPVGHDAAMRAAREFEAMLLSQFTSIMFSGIESEGPFGGGPAEDIYKGLLSEEYGKVLASSGGIGLADAVYREIIKSQEVE